MPTEGPGYITKTEPVAALIRELLITGELQPGEQLRQRDLAQRETLQQFRHPIEVIEIGMREEDFVDA